MKKKEEEKKKKAKEGRKFVVNTANKKRQFKTSRPREPESCVSTTGPRHFHIDCMQSIEFIG